MLLMMFKKLLIAAINIFFVFSFSCAAVSDDQDAGQQMNEFSLSGYEEKGRKSWDIYAKSADIFENNVALKEIVSNLYGEEENVKLTAETGDFDKKEGKVHLENNVIVTTSSGAELTTDSLDWDRKNQLVTTDDMVNIKRENMTTVAQGAKAEPSLNKVTLQKDVTVRLDTGAQAGQPVEEKNRTTITCDGPVELDYSNNIVKFNNNVEVDNKDIRMYSDTMDVYFIHSDKKNISSGGSINAMGSNIEKIIAKGNVKIVRGENVSYSQEAVYAASDKKITLLGKPKLVIYSSEDMNASFGN